MFAPNRGILVRVFRLYVGNDAGTCFTIEHNNEQFLVTAKHLFKKAGFPNDFIVSILKDHSIVNLTCEIACCIDPVDIAVLKPNPSVLISPISPVVFKLGGAKLGEEAGFLGYPFDFDPVLRILPTTVNPIPFFKHAYISCFLDEQTIALDGINNPGFSGSPAFRMDGGNTIIFGVISGYRYVPSVVYKEEGDKETNTGLYVKENTGIVYVYSIQKVLDLLEEKWPSK